MGHGLWEYTQTSIKDQERRLEPKGLALTNRTYWQALLNQTQQSLAGF